MRITVNNFKDHLCEEWGPDSLDSIRSAVEVSQNCGYKIKPVHAFYRIELFFGKNVDSTEILKRAPKRAQYKLLRGLNFLIYYEEYKQLMQISEEINYTSYLYKSSNPRFILETNFKPFFVNKFTKNTAQALDLLETIVSEVRKSLNSSFESMARSGRLEGYSRMTLDKREIVFTALLLMIEQFGFENVSKAISKFNADETEVTIYGLFKVASDWESNKDFPLDWILT